MSSRGKLMVPVATNEFESNVDMPNINNVLVVEESNIIDNGVITEFESIDSIPLLSYKEVKDCEVSNCVIEHIYASPGHSKETASIHVAGNLNGSNLNGYETDNVSNDPDYDYDEYLRERRDISTNESNISHISSTDSSKDNSKKRNRKAVACKWRKNETKRLRAEGKSYMGYRRSKGKVYQDTLREARKLGAPCISKECLRRKKRQCARITQHQREKIFHLFWNLTTWDQRRTFVANHVQLIPKKSLVYYLTVDGEKWEVCKKLFLSTISLGESTIHSWLKNDESSASGMLGSSTFRNKMRHRPNRTDLTQSTNFAREFLTRIPKLPSHYARSSSTKLYLEPVIRSMNQLYELYTDACQTEGKQAISRCSISNLFHDMNLSIHPVKKDKCDTCVKHEVGQISDEEWQLHINLKNRARIEKEQDKLKALNNECKVLTMDLQAVKVSPWVQASAIFYKTKLCCHNFTMFDLASRETFCFWFDETAADLTSSTFATCILQYLEQHCIDTMGPIILYSDGCVYQNRNMILSNALLSYAVENNKEVIQKFLVVGHTQMECDSVHSTIERKLKGRDIYIPQDYIRFTKEARKNPPYSVKQMNFSEFKNYSVKKYQRYSSIRPGKVTSDPVVTDLRALRYLATGQIEYKLDFDQEWVPLPQRSKAVEKACWPPMHQEARKRKKEKWNHLQQLKSIIPTEYHHYYDKLKHD